MNSTQTADPIQGAVPYLKQWLSREDVRELRNGGNEKGIVLGQRQVWTIMHNPKTNFVFFRILMKRAKENEDLFNQSQSSTTKPTTDGKEDLVSESSEGRNA